MKNARIMLAAIAVFAVVGGAFAFKAKGLSTYYKFNPDSQVCDIQTQLKEVPVTSTHFTISATTNSTGAGCAVLTVTDAE